MNPTPLNTNSQTQTPMQGIRKEAEYKETDEGSVQLWPAVMMSSPEDSVKVLACAHMALT